MPHNLTLLITGISCPLASLLHTLNTIVEPSILSHPPSRTSDWKRPFLETSTGKGVTWPEGDRTEVVEFMESDESMGEVQIGFGNGVQRTDWVGCLVRTPCLDSTFPEAGADARVSAPLSRPSIVRPFQLLLDRLSSRKADEPLSIPPQSSRRT